MKLAPAQTHLAAKPGLTQVTMATTCQSTMTVSKQQFFVVMFMHIIHKLSFIVVSDHGMHSINIIRNGGKPM